MRLVKARVRGYRSIIDSGYFDIEENKTILIGPNEAGKTVLLQALQKLNPASDDSGFDPLRDYPRSRYDEDIERGGIDISTFTVVEGHFKLSEDEKESVPEEYRDLIYIVGRCLDNKIWHRLENTPPQLLYKSIEKDIIKILSHIAGKDNAAREEALREDTVRENAPNEDTTQLPDVRNILIPGSGTSGTSKTASGSSSGSSDSSTALTAEKSLKIRRDLDAVISKLGSNSKVTSSIASQITNWLDTNISYITDGGPEEKSLTKLREALVTPEVYGNVLTKCDSMLPKFILFDNYIRVHPSIHLANLATRVEQKLMDDSNYDYGSNCLLKLLGFTARELSLAGLSAPVNTSPEEVQKYKDTLDRRDYRLNAASVRLSKEINRVWNPNPGSGERSKFKIKADGQYLKVVVEDESGAEVEFNQRSEGYQWLVSFFIVFFSESLGDHKNAILLLDEPGLSLHGLKQAEFRDTLSKLSESNQTIFTTHSPYLIGPDELPIVRVVEMLSRDDGTKIHTVESATDDAALLPVKESLRESERNKKITVKLKEQTT